MKRYTWIIQITVDETWVEDGFDLTEEGTKNMIETALPYSWSHETSVKVLQSPTKESIRKAQGYKV